MIYKIIKLVLIFLLVFNQYNFSYSSTIDDTLAPQSKNFDEKDLEDFSKQISSMIIKSKNNDERKDLRNSLRLVFANLKKKKGKIYLENESLVIESLIRKNEKYEHWRGVFSLLIDNCA